MEYADIFKDKVVLITGGTGFLGHQIVQRILPYQPKSIRLFSRDEVKHFHTQNKFKDDRRLRYLIGDVRDENRLRQALRGVDILIHAAALKRIDILEYNVEESIRTNVMGTLNVAKACWEQNVSKAIFVSTDKACAPVNTYGACKFIGERIFTEMNYNKGKPGISFLSVRYGNVLDSTGSVIPCFTKQIKNNEPIFLTDERMTRFLISPSDAVELIMKAAKHGIGGEVFVPKLRSFKVTDLIKILVEHYQHDPGIKHIGIRPGEKIHEVLINESEAIRTNVFGNCFIIKSNIEKYAPEISHHYLHDAPSFSQQELSSKDFLISKDELQQVIMQEKLLPLLP